MSLSTEKIRSCGAKCFDSDINNISTQLQMLICLSKIVPSVSVLSMPFEIQQMFQNGLPEDVSMQQFQADIAMNVEKWLAITNMQKVDDKVLVADEESLSAAWYVLDFYIGVLNNDNCKSIKIVMTKLENALDEKSCCQENCGDDVVEETLEVQPPVQNSSTESVQPPETDCNDETTTDTDSLPEIENEGSQKQDEAEIVENKDDVTGPKFETSELDEESLKQLKKEAISYIPQNLNSASGQRELLSLIKILFNDNENILKMDTAWANAESVSGEDAGNFRRRIGESAICVESAIMHTDIEYLRKAISETEKETLAKAWIALDYYAFVLKMEFNPNIRNLRDYIAGVLLEPQPAVIEEVVTKSIDEEVRELQENCYSLEQTAKDSPQLFDLKKQLGEKLLQLDAIYVAYDEDYVNTFPYIGLTGKMEIFTKEEYAYKCKEYFALCDEGHFSVRKIEKSDIEAFFDTAHNLGIRSFNLDNGAMNIELVIDSFCPRKNNFIIDENNTAVRNSLIRRLQIVERFNKISNPAKKAESEKTYATVLNNITSAGYTNLCNGIVYALMHGPYVENVTFYTEKACRKVQKRLDERGISSDLNLIASGDNRYTVVENVPRIGVINIRDKGMHACIFTDKSVAAKVRDEFSRSGSDDNIIAMTFEEVLPHALRCEGIAVDMPEYAYMISKKELENINAQIQQQK